MTQERALPADINRSSLLILVCFFLSGLTALIYEIIWMRMISEVIGGAPFAVSAILFVFMGGMGAGSYLASRRIDNIDTSRLIGTYGALELAIGVYAFFVPLILLFFKFFYGILYNALSGHPFIYNLFIFAGALLLLGIPTLCMGATLPILCRFYVVRLSHLGTHTGRLYGLNTIGAAAGSIICGFWMIQTLGVWGTLLTAVAINCAIGLVCLGINPQTAAAGQPKKQKAQSVQKASANALQKKEHASKKSKGQKRDQNAKREPSRKLEPAPKAATPQPREQIDPQPHSEWVINSALTLFLISGFSAMAYEVMWTKLLGLLVGPTTYSFTIVLATFIVGLAMGNILFGRLADKSANPLGLLVFTQIASALLALGASQIMGNSQLFFAKLIYTFKGDFAGLSLAKAAALFALMMPPTLFLGATFPLVAKIYSRSLKRIGRSIGIAYTVNTIGAVLGSICAGLILIPLVGKESGLKIVVIVQLVFAIAVGIATLLQQRGSLLKWGGLAAAAVAGIYLCAVYPAWNRHLLAKGKYHRFEEISFAEDILSGTGWAQSLFNGAQILAPLERGKLLYYGDGIGGFTTVLEYPVPFGMAEYSMANSGKMDASSRGDMNTQTALAHFPMLFADNPQQVMVLGLASGITAGETLHYPIKQLDVVDINDRVEAACRFFDPWNNKVLDDPRTNLIFQDGRAHLALTEKQYDVIISEPSNPWMAGMATLFTKDFFQVAKERLTQNGIYVQWFHCYQMDWSTFSLIGRTFANVFPQSLLVSTSPEGLGRDYLLVGLNSESGLNWDNARSAVKYLQRSANISMASPELYARQIVSENLTELFGRGPINSDDQPLLEYTAPKLMHSGGEDSGAILRNISGNPGLTANTKAIADKVGREMEMSIDFAAYALSVHTPFKNMVDLAAATLDQKHRFYELMKRYAAGNPVDYDLIEDAELANMLRDLQIDVLKREIERMPFKEPSYTYLSKLYDDKQMRAESVSSLQKAIELDPDNAGNHNNLGYLFDQAGKYNEAEHHYMEALRVNPYAIITWGNLGFLNLRNNQPDKALGCFEAILRIKPDQPDALYQIGLIFAAKNDPAQASRYLRKAIEIDPNFTDAINALSQIQSSDGRR